MALKYKAIGRFSKRGKPVLMLVWFSFMVPAKGREGGPEWVKVLDMNSSPCKQLHAKLSLSPHLISPSVPLSISVGFFLFLWSIQQLESADMPELTLILHCHFFWWSNLAAMRPSKAFGKHSKREQWEQDSEKGEGGSWRSWVNAGWGGTVGAKTVHIESIHFQL